MNPGENKSYASAHPSTGACSYNLRISFSSRVYGFGLIEETKSPTVPAIPNSRRDSQMISAYIFLAIGAAAGFLLASVFFVSKE